MPDKYDHKDPGDINEFPYECGFYNGYEKAKSELSDQIQTLTTALSEKEAMVSGQGECMRMLSEALLESRAALSECRRDAEWGRAYLDIASRDYSSEYASLFMAHVEEKHAAIARSETNDDAT